MEVAFNDSPYCLPLTPYHDLLCCLGQQMTPSPHLISYLAQSVLLSYVIFGDWDSL